MIADSLLSYYNYASSLPMDEQRKLVDYNTLGDSVKPPLSYVSHTNKYGINPFCLNKNDNTFLVGPPEHATIHVFQSLRLVRVATEAALPFFALSLLELQQRKPFSLERIDY